MSIQWYPGHRCWPLSLFGFGVRKQDSPGHRKLISKLILRSRWERGKKEKTNIMRWVSVATGAQPSCALRGIAQKGRTLSFSSSILSPIGWTLPGGRMTAFSLPLSLTLGSFSFGKTLVLTWPWGVSNRWVWDLLTLSVAVMTETRIGPRNPSLGTRGTPVAQHAIAPSVHQSETASIRYRSIQWNILQSPVIMIMTSVPMYWHKVAFANNQ